MLISFIVPIYNGEKYLRQCLDSLIHQSICRNEYEIICIDDCSIDKSRDILIEYASVYSNVKYIFNTHNLKTGTSLNKALRRARGKYIWIIGQDDTIVKDVVNKLLFKCESLSLDVLAFNYNRVDSNGDLIMKDVSFSNSLKQDGKMYIYSYFYNNFCNYLLGYEWRAIYNLEFLKSCSISFPDNTIYEDTLFLFNAFWNARNMMTIKDCIYNYRQNESSITNVVNRYQAVRIYDFFMISDEVLKFAKQIEDDHIRNQLIDVSKKYLQSFVFTIIPATLKEKFHFYDLIKLNRSKITPNIIFLPWYIKVLLHPFIGVVMTSLLKPLYLLKKFYTKKEGFQRCSIA